MRWIELFSIVLSVVSAVITGLWLNLSHHYDKGLFAVIGLTAILMMVVMKMGGVLPAVLLEGAIASRLKDKYEKYKLFSDIAVYTVLFAITLVLAYFITGLAGGLLTRK